MSFKEKYESLTQLINNELDILVQEKECPERSIYSAMRYSLAAGGKRLRPVLTMAVCEMLEGDLSKVLPFACAIEMIHTYSLIHDDLPCMDDDDYRRGMPTNHKVFGEGIAVLAGDALLNHAFEVMLDACVDEFDSGKVKAMKMIAAASGVSGMIGGQVIDLESENKAISQDVLMHMHKCKTGALIKVSVVCPAVLISAQEYDICCLEQFAEKLGLAFQIKDDILDVEGNAEIMGKPCGSDLANSKSTFITMFGLEQSKKMLDDITNQAVLQLEKFRGKADFLKNLAQYLVERDK